MARKKRTAAEYIATQEMFVPVVIGDMIEHLGEALQAWGHAVWYARNGDQDEALKAIVDVDVAVDVPMRVGISELRSIMRRAQKLLDLELPGDDDGATE